MNTTENNKIIAEFMRLRKSKCTYTGRYLGKIKGYEKVEEECFTIPESHPIVENIYTDRPGFDWQNGYSFDDLKGKERELVFCFDELEYHISWNWLMSVIEKIRNELYIIIVKYNLDGITVKIKQNYDESIIIATGFDDTCNPIKAYYSAILEFIKWYNENKLRIN